MEFDLSKELAALEAVWKNACFYGDGTDYAEKAYFTLSGPKGCGKTKIAQDYVKSHANAVYLSFSQVRDEDALKMFLWQYVPEAENITDWKQAVAAFMKRRRNHPTLVIFEEGNSAARNACEKQFLDYAFSLNNVKICSIQKQPSRFHPSSPVVRYRSPRDFIKAFPDYPQIDAMRLQALTGGILSVAKELDRDADFEENLRRLLRYDSAFTTYLPQWLSECFRCPESYYPILCSIANGHFHLAEIAKDCGYSNNKCLTYLQALIQNGFVLAEKDVGKKQSTYHISNSYIAAWCRYACGKQMQQVAFPEQVLQNVKEDIDQAITLPAIHRACFRFIEAASKDCLYEYHLSNIIRTERNVSIRLQDGNEITLDYCVKADYYDFYFIFPHDLHEKITKTEMEQIYEAINRYDSVYNSYITVFGVNRFSDWCVHEAAVNSYLQLVTLEQLKF